MAGNDAVYNHLCYLLHLPKVVHLTKPVVVDPSGLGYGWKPKTLRRIKRPESDLFDSDCSSDEESGEKSNLGPDSEHALVKVKPRKDKDPGASIMIQSLSALSSLYDTISVSDAYLSAPSDFKEGRCPRHTQERWCSGRLTSGMSDEKKYYDEINWWKRNYCDEILSEVNCRSLEATNTRLRNCTSEMVKLPSESANNVKDRLTIPVPKDTLDQVMVQDETNFQFR